MTNGLPLGTHELMAAVAEALEHPVTGGYVRVNERTSEAWPSTAARLFEDPWGVVAVVVFETWADLVERWPAAQAALVEILSKHFAKSDPKVWDGYLVLLTSDHAPSPEAAEAIRYDVTQVRKLVADGAALRSLSDVTRALDPLLPLEIVSPADVRPNGLDRLGSVLESQGFEGSTVRAVLTAFEEQGSLMKAIDDAR